MPIKTRSMCLKSTRRLAMAGLRAVLMSNTAILLRNSHPDRFLRDFQGVPGMPISQAIGCVSLFLVCRMFSSCSVNPGTSIKFRDTRHESTRQIFRFRERHCGPFFLDVVYLCIIALPESHVGRTFSRKKRVSLSGRVITSSCMYWCTCEPRSASKRHSAVMVNSQSRA